MWRVRCRGSGVEGEVWRVRCGGEVWRVRCRGVRGWGVVRVV